MTEFVKSPHHIAQTRYERALGEAHASNSEARKNSRQQIEDDLVKGGQKAIDEYRDGLDERRKAVRCIPEYEGVHMGYAICDRAQARLDAEK